MSLKFDIEIGIDEAQLNQQIARIDQRFSQLGQRVNPNGLNSLNANLQQMISHNPQIGNVIRSLGQTGTAATGSSRGVQSLTQHLQQLAAINPQIARLVNGLQGVGGAAANAASSASGSMGAMGSAAQAAMGHLGGLGGSMAGIATAGAALGVTAAVGGLVALGAAAVSASAKFEAYRASLTTILGDSEKASQAFDRLTQFAAQTPFSLDQSVEGFIKLKALGLTPSEEAMRSYGNTASAMGKDLMQLIEAVADASTGEFERLKEFGIKASKQGNDVAFTFQGIRTKVGNNSKEIQAYLQKIGDVNFAGAMAKQMETFNGAMANLQDTTQQTLAKIGDGLNKPIASVINLMTTGLTAVTPLLVGIGNLFGGLISGVASIASGLGSMFTALTGGSTGSLTLLERLTAVVNLLGQGFAALGSIIGAVLGAAATVITSVANVMSSAWGTALNYIGVSFESGGRSWTNSIIGVLRAAKAVVAVLPQLFAAAIGDVMGMFSRLGSIVGRLLSGDLSALSDIGDAVTNSFGRTARAIGAVGKIAGLVYADQRGADAAWQRMTGRETKTAGPSLSALAGTAPTPAPTPGDSDADKKKKAAEEEAKKAAERLKREREFFETLDQNAKVAAMMPLEAERYNKELELRKILGDGELKDAIQLSAAQREHIANALALKNVNDVIRGTKEAIQAADMDAAKIAAQVAAQTGVTAEKAAENLAVESKLWPMKQAAMQKGVNLADAELQRQLAILDAKERQNYQTERANELANQLRTAGVDYAKAAVATDGSRGARMTAANDNYAQRMRELEAAKASISPAQFQAGVARAAREFREEVAAAGLALADQIGNVLGTLADKIGGKIGDLLGRGADTAQAISGFAKTQSGLQKQITDMFGGDAASPLAKGIGKSVGGAIAGLEIGNQIGGAMKSLGLKGSENGAKIGGAIGGLTGNPLIAAGASVVGGLLGSLFYKPKYATAQLTGADSMNISSRGKGQNDIASGLGGSVQEGLANIAKQLGGTVGQYLVSIGTYEGQYRVSTSGQTGEMSFGKKNKSKSTLYDFGEDQAAAIAFAIKDAVADGAIAGLTGAVAGFVKSLDIEAAIKAAQDWNAVLDELASRKNPVSSAIKAINSPLDALRDTLIKTGASAADLSKVEELRALKMADLMKEQTKTFTDLMDSLNGEATGVTALDRLKSDLSKLDVMKADIAAGKQVDQNDFASLVAKIRDGNKDVWGTATGQGQSITQMLKDTVKAAEQLVRNEFSPVVGNTVIADDNGVRAANDATANAINAGNAAVTQRIDNTNAAMAVNNGYQEKILEALERRAISNVEYSGVGNSRVSQV